MNFYTYETWVNSQLDCDESENLNEKYSIQFNNLKNRLNCNFLSEYYNNQGFHDFYITRIYFQNATDLILKIFKPSNSLIIKRRHKFNLQYLGVKSFAVYYPDYNKYPNMQIGKHLEWGYDEFSENNGNLVHSILTSSGKEIIIEFKELVIAE